MSSPDSAKRVAAIDCGTNSIRLLVAEVPVEVSGGRLVDLDRRLEIVRLGQGVDATGEFHPDALARTFAVVDGYAELIKQYAIDTSRIHFVATSAARDASNREEFFAGIQQRLGVLPEVISGDQEARLSFTGALSRLAPTEQPVLVMDIGGGSTELISGSPAGQISAAVSLDIGSVRLTERFLHRDPPHADDLAKAADYIDAQLDGSPVDLTRIRTWIGVAGTATTLAAIQLGLQTYDRERVHGSTISRNELCELLICLSARTVTEIREIPAIHPQRADVITAGTLIAERIAARVATAELVVSESDILDGIALQLLDS